MWAREGPERLGEGVKEDLDQNRERTVDYRMGIWLHQEANRGLAVPSELCTPGKAWRSFSIMSSKHRLTSWLLDPTSSAASVSGVVCPFSWG